MKISQYELYLDNKKHPYLEEVNSIDINWKKEEYVKSSVEICKKLLNMDKLAEEAYALISLDVNGNPLAVFKVSHGTMMDCLVGPKETYKRVLLSGGSGMIFIHNHPSGCVAPSKNDKDIYSLFKTFSPVFEIELFDMIIMKNNYYSFVEHGIKPNFNEFVKNVSFI